MSRPLLSIAVIAAALALGFGAGEMLSRLFRKTPDNLPGTPASSVSGSPPGADHAREATGALSDMSAEDFSALRAALRNPSTGPGGITRHLHDLAARIVGGLHTAADCARAASLIDDMPPGLSQKLTVMIFRRWAALDPAAALTAADRLKNWQCQRWAAELVLKTWAARDPAAALRAVVSSPPGFVKSSGLQSILYDISKEDPSRALSLLSQLPKTPPAALHLVLSAWAKDHPGEAWAWAGAQNDPARREQAGRAVLSAMASSGQQQSALDLARQQPEGRVRRQMVSEVMRSWIRKDPDDSLASAAKLPAAEFTPEMAHSMVRSAFNILDGYALGSGDPQAWAEKRIGQFPPGPLQDAVRTAMAVDVLPFNLGHEFQPQAALPLLAAMPDGPWKSRATADLAAAWTHTDAVAASEWLASLPPSPTRDAAVTRFVERIALSDPERARQWAATIQER